MIREDFVMTLSASWLDIVLSFHGNVLSLLRLIALSYLVLSFFSWKRNTLLLMLKI